MWDEVGITPTVVAGRSWAHRIGSTGREVDFLVDSEFQQPPQTGSQKLPLEKEDGEAVDMEDGENVDMEGGEPVEKEGQSQSAPADLTFAKSKAIPNVEAMSEEQFQRYLEELRRLRPAFRKYLEERYPAQSRSATLLQRSLKAGDEFRDFLQVHAYQQYHAPLPRSIEQRPHRVAGLTYTHAPSI